ncbi:glycosyltransferase [Pontibacter sp. MBLB2868]|uniref:glycosyltransferase n=1 Tax=Pontibacter sp. MBLB2868 TaxID=3451555 RepID=UPI003F750619
MDPSSGGPCQVIRNTVPELEKLGVVSEVACLDDPVVSFWDKDRFKVIALGPSNNPWRYNRKLASWLISSLEQYNAVIVHGLWLYHNFALLKAIQRLKKRATTGSDKIKIPKVYIMPHGMLDPYFQRAPERKLKAIRNVIYWALIESKVVREADGLLFTCEEELRLARTSFSPYQPKQEQNVGLGIIEPPLYNFQMQEAFRSKCNNLDDCPYFLFLGRIHEKKGVDLLLKAFAKLVKELSAVQLGQLEVQCSKWNLSTMPPELAPLPKLVIAGPGIETPFGQELQKFVQDNKELCDTVLFPGMLAGDAKWGALYGCEAFILPSHQENFGIAVVEALACAKPVLISNQVNIWHEIHLNGCGLVASDTLEGTQSLITSWLNLSAKNKKAMGTKAFFTYNTYFAIKSQVMLLHKVISK